MVPSWVEYMCFSEGKGGVFLHWQVGGLYTSLDLDLSLTCLESHPGDLG